MKTHHNGNKKIVSDAITALPFPAPEKENVDLLLRKLSTSSVYTQVHNRGYMRANTRLAEYRLT
jgi:hypothetical protein